MAEKITSIRVFGTGYHGKPTLNKHVPGGTYDAADPLLNGQAEYLVKNGHAEVTGKAKMTKAEVKAASEEKAAEEGDTEVATEE